MKGFKIKKKDRRKPVHVNEVKKTCEKCVPPKQLITKVHSVPQPRQAIIKLEVDSGVIPVAHLSEKLGLPAA
jgi:hypothetical protein